MYVLPRIVHLERPTAYVYNYIWYVHYFPLLLHYYYYACIYVCTCMYLMYVCINMYAVHAWQCTYSFTFKEQLNTIYRGLRAGMVRLGTCARHYYVCICMCTIHAVGPCMYIHTRFRWHCSEVQYDRIWQSHTSHMCRGISIPRRNPILACNNC